VLRTRLIDRDGEPAQVIDPPTAPGEAPLCRSLSLGHLLGTARDEALRTVLGGEAGHVFDLAVEHPIRALLVDLGPGEHVLAITMHHVASDGWSTGVLMRECATLYNRYSAGDLSPLAALPVQYADFAQWQRSHVEDAATMGPQLEYWRTQLANAPGVVNLPEDGEGLHRHDPADGSSRATAEGSAVYFRIDSDIAGAVNALARRTDASAYMVLLAAFVALLHRWSGDVDVTVGSPIANRPRKELEDLIGFFVNTLAVRVNLDGEPDLLGLIARVRRVALDAYAHADLPFEHIVEKLNPERRLNKSPFFQVMFAMQSGAAEDVALNGLRIEAVPLTTGASRFDLTLSIQETPAGFAGCLEFSTALFRMETAQRFAEHFRNMVRAIVRQPETPLSQVDYLSDGERHRLLVEWNRTEMPTRRRCLHQLVEEQAARTPDAIAVRWNGQAWTYTQLMQRAETAARLLQQKGVTTETLVGVCMERTPDMIAAMLGVLCAGGAYVALDPAYPVARTEFVLADSGATIVLRDGALDELVDDRPFTPPSISTSNLAYVLYTSGSTGQPKGVAIEHRSPVALIDWARSVWSSAELSGVLAGTSICFDLSVFEIFLPLSVGGTVVLAGSVLDLPDLADKAHVTLVNTVPSAIDALLHQRAVPANVRVVNLAGEPLTTELADRIYDVPTVEKVFDLYGPSEDTTYSTFTLRRRGDPPSIGRPIANTRLYILDRALQPVPIGVPGEIFLGGHGLARGYLGRPDLTDERFIPSPFPGIDRLYRTGDRARFRDDGNVEFMGRFDHQVKLRGFRIELGEIESVARQFPDVGQCVVTVEDGHAGNKRLVGYVSHPHGQTAAVAIQAHLRSRLPEYMVPPVLVVLTALPLTPNGKIDRKALPSPEGRAVVEDAGPLTPAEERLAAVWQSLLAVERVRPLDDFFGLGGHSLLAARLGTRIRDEFQVDLPLRSIFEYPALRTQAEAIARLLPDERADAIVPIERHARLPMSFAQERLWFLDQLEPGNSAYNMAGAIRLRGAVDVPTLREAFALVVDRHESLRMAFPTVDGRGHAVLTEARPTLRDLADIVDLDTFLREEQARPFNLATSPLIRATVIRIGPDESVLAVTMHHIISDGWSVEVFLDDLCRLYAAQSDGSRGPLAPLPVQYVDFADWQRRAFESGRLAGQLGYWREALRDAPTVLDLPTDRPRPDAQSYQGDVHSLVVEADLAALVARHAREHGVTSFMTLLAAYAAALHRWSGQHDFVIGFPAAGRSRRELESVIGMFVNTVPIRVQIAAGMTFADLLAQVKTRSLDALTHQDVPFEKLVDELGVERSLSWSPLFQVMFINQQARPVPPLPDGLQVEPIAGANSGTAKFDLTLAVAERTDGLAVNVEYDVALFDAATIERFAAEYVETLRRGLTAPHVALESSTRAEASGHRVAPATAAARPDVQDVRPATAAEMALAGIWRDLLGLKEVRVTDNFFEVGGDSIVSIQVIAQLRERGWRIEPKQIFRHQTIRALAAVAEPVRAVAETGEDHRGPLSLMPMQRLFFELEPPSLHHFNQALLLLVTPDLVASDLQTALTELVRVHPALRSRFLEGADGWQELVGPAHDVELESATVTSLDEIESVCQAVQRRLDISSGPVFRAVLVHVGTVPSRLLLVAHHLVVDAVSWRIILSDIETAYAQVQSGRPVVLPAEHCGPATFRSAVATWFRSAGADEETFWMSVAPAAGFVFSASRKGAVPVPRTVTTTLSAEQTAPLLATANRAYNTNVADLLLAAFGRTLARMAGRERILVDVEGHGRDAIPGVDLSRSVGWFTTLFPVQVPDESDAAGLIRAVKESYRSVPNGGIGFGLRRVPGEVPLTDVSFNYLGQSNAAAGKGVLLGIAPESPGDSVAADMPRRYHLELNASVVDGRLVTQYSCDARVVSETVVADVAERTTALLRELVAHCLTVDDVQYTPSDFSTVSIEQDDLDALLGDLDLSGLEEQ
jgi:amino acid adenylation domain-containing protein/non-ribosomal peptide synthase protein (TIGR01720 family)